MPRIARSRRLGAGQPTGVQTALGGAPQAALALLLWLWLALAVTAECACPPELAGSCVARRTADGQVVQFPRLHWTPVASATPLARTAGMQVRYLRGRASSVTRNVSAAALGLNGQTMSGLFFQPPGAAPVLFARFAPGSNTLRIDLLRIEHTPDGRMTVAAAQFGPHHGERFVVSQDYISAGDRQNQLPGINPLRAWLRPEDNLFHDICFQCRSGDGSLDPYTSGVATAVGLAMQFAGASTGILAVAREWIDVQQESSGGLLWSTVKVKTYGYAQPDWWLASPIGAQAGATDQLGTCAVAGEQPCLPEHTVLAGIALAPWAGLNLPTDRDLLYYSEDSHSGFTVLGYAVVTALLVGAGSYAWGGEMLGGGGIEAANAGLQISSAGAAGSAGLNAITAFGGYSALSNMIHPGSPDRVQQGYLGSTFGIGSSPIETSKTAANATVSIETTRLQTAVNLAAGLTGVRKLHTGSCNEADARSKCATPTGGTTPRVNAK